MTAKEIRRRISSIENVELSLSGKTTGPLITGWAAMEIAAQLAELNETLKEVTDKESGCLGVFIVGRKT